MHEKLCFSAVSGHGQDMPNTTHLRLHYSYWLKMKFVSKITTRDVTELTFEEYLKIKASVPPEQFTMCEYLQGDDLYTKPFYDFEQYFDKEPSASVKEQVFNLIKYSMCDTFQADENFDLAKSVAIATRHGHVGGKYKLSFRVFVLGYAIKYVQMPALIKAFCPGVNFDMSPYKAAEQLLAVVGGCKGKVGSRPDDRRVLTPLTHQNEPWVFLAQALRGDENYLEIATQTHDSDGNDASSGNLPHRSTSTNRGKPAEQLGVADIDPRIMPAVEAALAAMEPSDTTSGFHRFTRFSLQGRQLVSASALMEACTLPTISSSMLQSKVCSDIVAWAPSAGRSP